MSTSYTYLTTEELAERIKYDCRTIRQSLKDTVLLEGVIPPFITGLKSRYQATMANFCLGVMPPSPILGRSLL